MDVQGSLKRGLRAICNMYYYLRARSGLNKLPDDVFGMKRSEENLFASVRKVRNFKMTNGLPPFSLRRRTNEPAFGEIYLTYLHLHLPTM